MKLPTAFCLFAVVGVCLPFPVRGQDFESEARDAFRRADSLSMRDGGALWGQSLSGPLLLVRPEDRAAISNRPAPGFEYCNGLFQGYLPDTIGVANTAFEWNGRPWSMVMSPLPPTDQGRNRLLAHELWHRIQDVLGFPSTAPANLHLDTRDGRYLIQLEWRALGRALTSRDDDREMHIAAALGFREQRLRAFPHASREEQALLMHEGLAEYTGLVLGVPAPDRAQAAAEDLEAAAQTPTFVRSFAYASGPAYGLLLDDLFPDWRSFATADSSLPDMLPVAPRQVESHRYDTDGLGVREDSLAAARAARHDEQLRRYVTGPLLLLDFGRMNVQFDPGRVEALDQKGTIYPGLTLSDQWGTLRALGGALILADWSGAVVPAPDDPSSRPIVGSGYVLELAPGWDLQPAKRDGDYRVVRTH